MNAVAAPGDISSYVGGGLGGAGGANSTINNIIDKDTLVHPHGSAFDAAGNLYVVDTGQHRIRKLSTTGAITTFAGTGNFGGSGDGGPARWAELRTPQGVAVFGSNVYIADTDNHRIRKVDSAGTITTFAGTGTAGFSGDSGAATLAKINKPGGVAVDSLGNLYIADSQNNRIRKVDTAGTITTIAGTGSAGFSGDGGPAASAKLSYPSGIATDGSDNIFIADRDNMRIRKITAATGIISTVAGDGYVTPLDCVGPNPGNGVEFNCDDTKLGRYNGDGISALSASLNLPWGVAVDGSGNILIADSYNHRVRRVDSATGIISTVAGTGTASFSGEGGPASAAGLNRPYGVATDSSSQVFIADTINDRIRKVNTSGTIGAVVGTGTILGCCYDNGFPARMAMLSNPQDVVVAGGSTYIADTSNHRIVKVDSSGIVSTVAGSGLAGYLGDGGSATSARLNAPYGVAVDSAGNLYISDSGNYRIRKVDTAGVITTFAGNGQRAPFAGDGGPATGASLNSPRKLGIDSAGNVYITDTKNHRIRKVVPSTGIITTVAGDGFFTPVGHGRFEGDGGQATLASLNFPMDVEFDSVGNMFIADAINGRIRKVDTTGVISTVAGTHVAVPVPAPGAAGGAVPALGDGGLATEASLAQPVGVTVDSLGQIFIADHSNVRVRKVDTLGIITTIAGNGCLPIHINHNGSAGFVRTTCPLGDNGPATKASLLYPTSVALMGSDLLVAEGVFGSPRDFPFDATVYSDLGFYQKSSWNRIRKVAG